MKLVAVNYQKCRLEFFREQLAAAQRELEWAVKRDYPLFVIEEKADTVSFYKWAVQMAEKDGDTDGS